MSSTSSILTLPAVDEPLELTKTAPILDPKIPFFKYLDMLTTISQNALSLRQQAYEIFLALNPSFSYASSFSASASSLSIRQQPVKVNKKIETLLESSMILLQRYYLIVHVSLPKLPSFRRRTHGNSLKAYEVRAAGYQVDLKQYQEEGGLLYLKACFVRAKAAERDLNKPVEPSFQVAGGASAGGAGGAPSPSPDGQMVAKAPTTWAKSVPTAKSTDKKDPEPSTGSTTIATLPVVVMVETPPKTKDHSSVLVAVVKRPPKTKDPPSVPVPDVVVDEQSPKTKEQQSVLTAVASIFPSSPPPSRHSSRRKKSGPEAQVKVEVEVEVTSTTINTAAIASAPATAGETTSQAPSKPAALNSTSLWKLERDLERLQKSGATMKDQSALIRTRAPKSTVTAIPTTAAPSTPTATPALLTAAALAQLSIATSPTATSTPLRSYLPAATSRPSPAAPSALISTPVHPTPATVNEHPSTVVIPENTTTAEQPKRSAKVDTVVIPAVTLTTPTPAGTPSTTHKPSTTRVTLSYSPPKEAAKSTNKRISPATGAIKGSGVVRNLIRQYETPSSASSTSSQSDRPDLQMNRRKKPTTTTAVTTSLTTPAGAPAIAANGLKTGNPSTSTITVAASTKTETGTTTTRGAGVGTGLLSRTRKDASPDLGDKQILSSLSYRDHLGLAPVSASVVKTRPVQNTPTRNRGSIRAENNNNGLTQPIDPPVPNTSASSASHSLSKAQSAITKSALILETHQTTHTQGQSRDQASKPRTAAEAVKDSYLHRSQTNVGADKQSSLQVPAQGQQSRIRPTFNDNDLWNNQSPPLSQARMVSSSSANTAIATIFRAGAESKPVVALGDPSFTPSNPPLGARPVAAVMSKANFSNRSSPISTPSKAMSSQESIKSWRRDVPVAASVSHPPNMCIQDENISTSAGPNTNQPAVDWLSEADYEDNDEEDDGLSHVDLIRIPTMSSVRSSATTTTSFSASHPLGSDRFKPRHRPSLSSALVQEKKQEETTKEDGKEVKRKPSRYVPDTDESDTDTANLQILEVPPTRDTQAWHEMRSRVLEHEREEEERRRLEEDGGDGGGPENNYGGYSQLEPQPRHDSKYSTTRANTNRQRQTATSSQPKLSHALKSRAPSFTQPFKPEHHHPFQHLSINSTHQHVSQHGPRSTGHYASTISSTSTRSIRQPSLAHSISPASSALISLRGTPAPTVAPSIKSFATGSTTTLEPPKFYPPSFTSSTVANAAPRSHYPNQGQTDDGTTDMAMRNIRAREAKVLGSLAEPTLGSQLRQLNAQSAATLVRNRSYYGHQHQQSQQQHQQHQHQ
ncbi:hypothetical protein KI688_004843 [Linnemannia hyalina]|uniref:Uncharacterized protein n=1 Tax=Linnemannia hyalina TaxID=64524 RepID=A0A9P7XNP8_9FUNG|nr:hypothetical protein KI688_004843 [Linnemannia hyalina]